MATLCFKEGWEMEVRIIMIDLASGTGPGLPEQNHSSVSKMSAHTGEGQANSSICRRVQQLSFLCKPAPLP